MGLGLRGQCKACSQAVDVRQKVTEGMREFCDMASGADQEKLSGSDRV